MPTTLITGANRGIGLEFTRQYAAAGWQVHATCRHPDQAHALQALAGKYPAIRMHPLDVADFDRIDSLARELQNESIDLLLNNAGIYPSGSRGRLGATDEAEWAQAFRVNSMAPLRMCEAFLTHVARSPLKKIALITSKMGSIDDNTSGGAYIYRTSKAALNMVARSLAIDLAPQGISVALLHPGWVRTDMGGPDAWISAEQSVTGMRQLIDRLDLERSGKFFAYDGQPIPW
ncbi:MAG: SDR family oxidoreductase [Methylobacterium sp.]|nr:SDR family oxidoreductase [Methylobacterium sp.]